MKTDSSLNTMEPHRNVLIVKGTVPATDVLDLLELLLREMKKLHNLDCEPQPWQVFSLICASGISRYGPYLCGRY
jgi:hypothetical protein